MVGSAAVYVDFEAPRAYFSNFIRSEIDDDRVAPNIDHFVDLKPYYYSGFIY